MGVRESLQKLYLLQLSLRHLLRFPPSVTTPEATTAVQEILHAPELSQLLAPPRSRPPNQQASTSALSEVVTAAGGVGYSQPTAVTGLVELRCIGCQGLQETFPAEMAIGDSAAMSPDTVSQIGLSGLPSASGLSGYASELTARLANDQLSEVRCVAKTDNKKTWESLWRHPSQQCWDSRTTFNVNRAKELQIEVFWRRLHTPISSSGCNVSIPGSPLGYVGIGSSTINASGINSAANGVQVGYPSSTTVADINGLESVGRRSGTTHLSATEEQTLGLEWVLAGLQYLRLEDFLDCRHYSLPLQLMPCGTVFLEVCFTDPLVAKSTGGRLRRQKRLFSKRKGT
ncbi:unnamed protein product [Protopolystoma xenopodis]|uniref:Uncharacterized protein n=1 Tax=Protopolystoma xenopodis TaxID=117903 RepID=A0A3S5CCQ2_9PLAT|nr:unnamed protein product [Protopolystoma xenopodis]